MLDRRLPIAVTAWLAFGCSDEPRTCRLPTSELEMWATVSDLDGEVEVEVEFAPIGGTATLELCPDRDSLFVNGTPAESIRVFGEHYYRVEFDSPAERYEIALERKDAQSVTVAVEMPPSYEITAPTPGSTHSRAANLDIEWTANWIGNQIGVALLETVGSSCIEGLGVFATVDDVGQHQIVGGSLEAGAAGLECELALLLTREVVVEHPPETFAGGTITANLNRGMVLISVE